MRFTIITPTLQRQSLIKCCSEVDAQIFFPYEHIVMVDCDHYDREIYRSIADNPRRGIFRCAISHRNYGNTCRHNAWKWAQGEYLIYVDDDNFLADSCVLEDIDKALRDSGDPDVAVFPILRHGHRFYSVPPRICHTDTANLVVKREYARWPDIPDYTADGIFAERVVAERGYVGFEHFRPIIVMPKSSEGK